MPYLLLEDMITEDHGCEITCQFCNNKYQFSEEDLKNIVDKIKHGQD